MDILWFCLGGFFSAAVIVIVLQHRKIQELQEKNEQELDKAPSTAASKLHLIGKQISVIALKCILWIAELFRWQGRYRRRSFWPRLIVLLFLCFAISEKIDAYLWEAFLSNKLTTGEYNFIFASRMLMVTFLLAPCIAKRLHDAGHSSILWFFGSVCYIPQHLLVNWSGFEHLYFSFRFICSICSIVMFIFMLTDSKENNKWGISPKYPNGKNFDGKKFMLK